MINGHLRMFIHYNRTKCHQHPEKCHLTGTKKTYILFYFIEGKGYISYIQTTYFIVQNTCNEKIIFLFPFHIKEGAKGSQLSSHSE